MTRLALVALSLLIPSAAFADVIGPGAPRTYPAPTNCPPGAFARTGVGSHGFPPRCEPSTCEADADCEGAGPCQPIGICVGDAIFGRGGTYRAAFGACETDADCEADPLQDGPEPPSCETVNRCAGLPGEPEPPPPPPDPVEEPSAADPPATTPSAPPSETSGCGCRSQGGPERAGALWLGLGLLAACVVRRR